MNSLLVAVLSLVVLLGAYFFYGRFITGNILPFQSDRPTPAHELEDGIDYVPTNRWILFGHHFSSIAGLGPIVGPAVAVIWGWVPALLWIVFGSILIGGVHDVTTLTLSVRNDGRSIGDVAAGVINKRARLLFLILTFFLISLAMGVFAYIVSVLFAKLYPGTVVPVFGLMVIAMVMGTLRRYNVLNLTNLTLLGLGALVLVFIFGAGYNIGLSVATWTYILMLYAFVAAVLPVWFLLQPRDYLNSYLLYAGLAVLYIGLIWLSPPIAAPALNSGLRAPADLPPLFPILFITVACGAVSGFHSLVSSGTTAKQLESEKDGLFVGYGAMLTEGLLALVVVLACVAGLGGTDQWFAHYGSWAKASGLPAKLGAFIEGGARLFSSWGSVFGVSRSIAETFLTLVIVSFAMTTLDSGTRLLRYNIEELVESIAGSKEALPAVNRWTASFLAVCGIGFFALLEIDGQPAGIFIWVLFGATNQLFAALGLLTVTVYLYRRNRPTLYTLGPMLFMIVITAATLVYQMNQHLPAGLRSLLTAYLPLKSAGEAAGSWIIFLLIVAIFILTCWFIWEAISAYRNSTPVDKRSVNN